MILKRAEGWQDYQLINIWRPAQTNLSFLATALERSFGMCSHGKANGRGARLRVEREILGEALVRSFAAKAPVVFGVTCGSPEVCARQGLAFQSTTYQTFLRRTPIKC